MMLNSCHQHSPNCQHNQGSIQDIAGTSSCVNMSHFNFNAINYSTANRRTNDSSDVYMPSVINGIEDVANGQELSADTVGNTVIRTSGSEGYSTNQCQYANSSHSFWANLDYLFENWTRSLLYLRKEQIVWSFILYFQSVRSFYRKFFILT